VVIEVFPDRIYNDFVDVWYAKISMQRLVIDVLWGVCNEAQRF